MIATTQYLGGSTPQKSFKIRCSEIASKAIFGPKLTTPTRISQLLHTTPNSLGHQLGQGISLITRGSVSSVLAHLTNIVTV